MKRFPALLLSSATAAAVATAAPAFSQTTIDPIADVMTSAFFQGTDLVRGFPGDNRATFRVANDNAFGVGPETIYLNFDAADFAGFSAPVPSATLTMESKSGGFGADASAGNPFLVSAHAVDADPIASITDDTNPGGTIAWDDFFANNILPADSSAITSVDAFGPVSFDITPIVNDWITGTNSVFSIALTGKNDPQTANMGSGFLHGFANNTEAPGSSFITVVPEPGIVATASAFGFFALRRRRA